jgi:hypothetical protein
MLRGLASGCAPRASDASSTSRRPPSRPCSPAGRATSLPFGEAAKSWNRIKPSRSTSGAPASMAAAFVSYSAASFSSVAMTDQLARRSTPPAIGMNRPFVDIRWRSPSGLCTGADDRHNLPSPSSIRRRRNGRGLSKVWSAAKRDRNPRVARVASV